MGDLFHTALTTADPLADAVVRIGGERGAEVRRPLVPGLVSGLASPIVHVARAPAPLAIPTLPEPSAEPALREVT